VIVVDATRAAVDADHAVVTGVSVGKRPVAVAVDPTGNWLYVALAGEDAVGVLDISSPDAPVPASRAEVGRRPAALAVTPDGSKVYVTNTKSGTVSVLETQPGSGFLALESTIVVGRKPGAIVILPPGGLLERSFAYATNQDDDTVSVIDTTTDQVVATIGVGREPTGAAAGLVPAVP
jgi:YVTN family beta-propeller protein